MKDRLKYFMSLTVTRTKDVAELIYDYVDGDKNRPVRLIGFASDPKKTDDEIRTEGYYFMIELEKYFAKK